MFKIVSDPIEPPDVECGSAGGFVSFVGRVRNEHEGRTVVRLEYEAHTDLAEAEGDKLLAEARLAFGLLDVRAIHRTGVLDVGEAAVWIGVAAPHRAEAFGACEWIIDGLKRRVPIWKKEHYAEGDSGWIGTDPVARIDDADASGRARKVALLVGVWPTDPQIGLSLWEAGATTLRLAGSFGPPTRLEGRRSARRLWAMDQVATFLRRSAPHLDVQPIGPSVDGNGLEGLVRGCDVVVDGTGDLPLALKLGDECRSLGVPLVIGRTVVGEGQTLSVIPEGPCLRCLWPLDLGPGHRSSSAPERTGLSQMAQEAANVLGGRPSWDRAVLVVDLDTGNSGTVARSVNSRCPSCGSPVASGVQTSDPTWEVDSLESARVILGPFRAIDVREVEEAPSPLPGWEPVWEPAPMSTFDPSIVTDSTPVVLVCRSGRRTGFLTDRLRELGFSAVYSLGGGVLRASQHVRS